MKREKPSLSFKLSYNDEKDLILISFENEDNTLTLPSSVYVPFISVLIKAGVDFQKNKVVDLGLSDLVKSVEEK